MFKKALLIITSTIFISQLASFYEKNYISENTDYFNKSFELNISTSQFIDKHLDNRPPTKNKNNSPRLYNNAKIVNQGKSIHTTIYTLLNTESFNFFSKS